jgi:hypothetical protein
LKILVASSPEKLARAIRAIYGKALALGRQSPALVFVKTWLFANELFESSYFFLQIFNHILLVPIHPTGNAEKYKR